jgi:hypothetical protein
MMEEENIGFLIYKIFVFLLFLPVLFSLAHAVKNIDAPQKRVEWLGWFLLFNIVAVVVYWVKKPYLTKK